MNEKSACHSKQLRKLLYSATLTSDPRKLASLKFVNPKYYDARSVTKSSSTDSKINNISTTGTYAMPSTLMECTIECIGKQKPIVLL